VLLNADASIRSNLDPFSKNTESSESHPEKADLPKLTTDDGIKIDFSLEFPTGDSSVRSDGDPNAN
jgi:hypothetical protein